MQERSGVLGRGSERLPPAKRYGDAASSPNRVPPAAGVLVLLCTSHAMEKDVCITLKHFTVGFHVTAVVFVWAALN